MSRVYCAILVKIDDKETLIDECFYTEASTIDDALANTQFTLSDAADKCEQRAWKDFDNRYESIQR